MHQITNKRTQQLNRIKANLPKLTENQKFLCDVFITLNIALN